MKTYRDSKILLAVIVVGCGRALAAGGERDQGTLMAGQGLDWQRSGTLLQPAREVQPAQPSDPIPYPPLAQAYNVNGAELTFPSSCEQIQGGLVLRCLVSAKAIGTRPDTQLCGHWLGRQPNIWLYVLKGRPDASGGFTFGLSGKEKGGAFLACSVTVPKDPNPWEWRALGAVGKCLLWDRPTGLGWIPETGRGQAEFNACLRAVRADYCGNGVTHTLDGTRIDLYGTREPHTVTAPNLLEATWNEHGALCVIHARWLVLSPTCQNRFNRVLGPTPAHGRFTGAEYHCDPRQVHFLGNCENCASEGLNIHNALTSGLLADDSLLQ